MGKNASLLVSGGGTVLTFLKNVALAIEQAGGDEREEAMLGKAFVEPLIEDFAQNLIRFSRSHVNSFSDMIQLGRFRSVDVRSTNSMEIAGQRFYAWPMNGPCKEIIVESKVTVGDVYTNSGYSRRLANLTDFLRFASAPFQLKILAEEAVNTTYLTLWRYDGDFEHGAIPSYWWARVINNKQGADLEITPVQASAVIWPNTRMMLAPVWSLT